MPSWATEGDKFPGIKSENHAQCVSCCRRSAALLRAPERILCENPLLTRPPASSSTRCSSLELCWLYLETSWWWLQFSTSSSCILLPTSWPPLWPVRTSWWEWLWCPSAQWGPWRAAGTLGRVTVNSTLVSVAHSVTLASTTRALSLWTGTLRSLSPWSMQPGSLCLFLACALLFLGSFWLFILVPFLAQERTQLAWRL